MQLVSTLQSDSELILYSYTPKKLTRFGLLISVRMIDRVVSGSFERSFDARLDRTGYAITTILILVSFPYYARNILLDVNVFCLLMYIRLIIITRSNSYMFVR